MTKPSPVSLLVVTFVPSVTFAAGTAVAPSDVSLRDELPPPADAGVKVQVTLGSGKPSMLQTTVSVSLSSWWLMKSMVVLSMDALAGAATTTMSVGGFVVRGRGKVTAQESTEYYDVRKTQAQQNTISPRGTIDFHP